MLDVGRSRMTSLIKIQSPQILNASTINMTNATIQATTSTPMPAGSATEALERAQKRQRTISNCQLVASALEAAFNFDQVFKSIPDPEESFPCISWDFDDEPQTNDVDFSVPLTISRKRDSNGASLGLVRSKSLKFGLSSLTDPSVAAPTKALFAKTTSTLHTLSSATKNLTPFKASSPQLGLNTLTRRSRFGGPSMLLRHE
jgi:hypothetical protein